MTVEELRDLLEDYSPEAEVRFASQPKWPFEYSIDSVVATYEDEDDCKCDSNCECDEDKEKAVYLVEGRQLGYLPGDAAREIGWR